MKLNLRRFAPLVLPILVLVLVFLAGDVGAAAAGATDGSVGLELAQGLLCDTKALLEGYVGLLLGLILIFIGVWSLVGGNSPKTAIVTIIFGALITSLPSLILSTMQGFGDLMKQSGLSSDWSWVEPAQCSSGGGNTPAPNTTPTKPNDYTIFEVRYI